MLNGSYKFKKNEQIFRFQHNVGMHELFFERETTNSLLIFKRTSGSRLTIDKNDIHVYSLSEDEAKIKYFSEKKEKLYSRLELIEEEKANLIRQLQDLELTFSPLKEKYPEEFI